MDESLGIFLRKPCFDVLLYWFFRILEENTQVKKNTTFFEELQNYRDTYRSYEQRTVAEIFTELMVWANYLSKSGKEMVKKAFEMAEKWHKGQMRKSGGEYITHPLTIACMTLPYRPDEVLLSSILLHDVLEDTDMTYLNLLALSPEVADIVEWATKIRAVWSQTENNSSDEAKFETIRKILTSSQKDIKILFLKVFDRLHNMLTLDAKSREWRLRIAKETRDIYAPLAKRCGLREVHHYLQCLAVEILEPEIWQTMKTFVENKYADIMETSDNICAYLASESWSKKILKINTQFLSPFSIDLKKTYHENAWYSIQIVVKELSDCYAILHDIGNKKDENLIPVGKINDLINQPRLSSYKGLHFDVIFQGVHRIKMRILNQKTFEKISQYPTFDDLGKIYSPVLFRDFELISEATASDSQEFMQSVTEHILARKIPLHSESRPLFYLPILSTALDAAIYLSPDRFNYIDAIYRNNEKIPLHTVLENNDIVTFTYAQEPILRDEWTEFVHSGVSKWRIRNLIAHNDTNDWN